MRSFKTELDLNNKQKILCARHVGTSRHAYNWGLALLKELLNHNRGNPTDKIKFPTAIDLHKLLVASVKVANPWYYEVSKCAPQEALRNLVKAFKRMHQVKGSGFPKFKKKNIRDSFYLEGSIKINGDTSQLCSGCGASQSMPLCKRQYECNVCNLSINRDLNASRNILNYARIAQSCK